MLKLVKALRVFRLIRAIDVLRLMLNALLGSIFSLLWSILMMSLIFYMFGVVLVQFTTQYLYLEQDGGQSTDPEIIDNLLLHFGSVEGAMLSLYMATTGGNDWAVYYNALDPTGSASLAIFLFFVAFSQIALMNILTGIFVEHAMELAKPNRQDLVAQHNRQMRRQTKHLEAIVREIDTADTGCISEAAFHENIREPTGKLRQYLASMGIHEADAVHFYHLLKSATFGKEVEIPHFVSGVMRLRGDVQNLDVQGLIVEMKIVHKKIHEVHRELRQTGTEVRRGLTLSETKPSTRSQTREPSRSPRSASPLVTNVTNTTWQC
jgi:hypothetical protein